MGQLINPIATFFIEFERYCGLNGLFIAIEVKARV
jgi:hypothetical protein